MYYSIPKNTSWANQIRTDEMQGSKPCALPLGDSPMLAIPNHEVATLSCYTRNSTTYTILIICRAQKTRLHLPSVALGLVTRYQWSSSSTN